MANFVTGDYEKKFHELFQQYWNNNRTMTKKLNEKLQILQQPHTKLEEYPNIDKVSLKIKNNMTCPLIMSYNERSDTNIGVIFRQFLVQQIKFWPFAYQVLLFLFKQTFIKNSIAIVLKWNMRGIIHFFVRFCSFVAWQMSHVPCILIHYVRLLPKRWFESIWICILIVQASNGICRSYLPWFSQYLRGELLLLLLNILANSLTHRAPSANIWLSTLWLFDFNFKLLFAAISIQSSSHRHHIIFYACFIGAQAWHEKKKLQNQRKHTINEFKSTWCCDCFIKQ